MKEWKSGIDRELNVIFGERNQGMKAFLSKCPTEFLLSELRLVCSKKEEELTYHDVEKIQVICKILREREIE